MAKYETMLVTSATLDEEATAALVGKSLTDGGGEKSAEVQKSCGAGSKTGYLCALRKIARRVSFLHIGGKSLYIGEK